MSALRPVLAVALAAGCLLGTVAHAADAPKTTDRSSTFYLAQEGCGATAEAGRLLPKATTSGATGCGTIGGLPIDEAIGGEAEPFATTGKGLPVKLDATKKITGQLAASSWIGFGAGAGEIAFDVSLTGVDVTGKTVDFGETVATGAITPGEQVAVAPFELTIPGTASKPFKSFTLNVFQRGANIGYSAKQLDGESYLVLPTKRK